MRWKQIHTQPSKDELLVNQLFPEGLCRLQEGQFF